MIAILIHTLLIVPVLASYLEIERPSATILNIGERVEDAYANGEVAVGIGVNVAWYVENPEPSVGPFFGRDGFVLTIAGTANTRMGVEYDISWRDTLPIPEHGPVFENTLNLGDNDGVWLSLSSSLGSVAFYSGPGLQNSSLYTKVWVCSNGFLCFDGEYTNPSPPPAMRNPQSPNAFIAPYWSDLDPTGGTISWGTCGYLGVDYFAVGWHNVLDKANNARQSFAVFIQQRSQHTPRFQNTIKFQYYNVQGSSNAVYGIEDQEGYKGIGGKQGAKTWTNKAMVFSCLRSTPEIKEMTIKLEKQDAQAEIYIGINNWELSGYNLQWKAALPAPEPWYYVALRGGATLLMSEAIGYLFGPVGGFLFGVGVVGYETAEAFSKSLWQAQNSTKEDADTTENLAYISVLAAGSSPIDWPVDTVIGSQVYWIFTDANSNAHQIKISIELKYYSYQLENETTISTSVDIVCPRDAGNTKATARQVTPGNYLAYLHYREDVYDFYNVTVPANKWICVNVNMNSTLYADLYLYDPSGEEVEKSEKAGSATEYINYHAASSGDYTIKVNASSGEGFYRLGIAIFDFELKVETRLTSGGEITNVKVWVNYELKYSPLATYTSETDHIVEVESAFIRIIELDIYEYTFVRWEDHSTNNPRTITIEENTILTAYYKVKYVGSISSIGDV